MAGRAGIAVGIEPAFVLGTMREEKLTGKDALDPDSEAFTPRTCCATLGGSLGHSVSPPAKRGHDCHLRSGASQEEMCARAPWGSCSCAHSDSGLGAGRRLSISDKPGALPHSQQPSRERLPPPACGGQLAPLLPLPRRLLESRFSRQNSQLPTEPRDPASCFLLFPFQTKLEMSLF